MKQGHMPEATICQVISVSNLGKTSVARHDIFNDDVTCNDDDESVNSANILLSQIWKSFFVFVFVTKLKAFLVGTFMDKDLAALHMAEVKSNAT